jgi:hypothetical protein
MINQSKIRVMSQFQVPKVSDGRHFFERLKLSAPTVIKMPECRNAGNKLVRHHLFYR